MPRSLILLLSFCLFALGVSFHAVARDNTALIGKWSMVSYTDTDGEPVHWSLLLAEDNGKLNGTLTSPDGEAQAKDFTYESGVIKFKAPYRGEDYDIELKLSEGQLKGTWSGGGSSGKTMGSRKN